tara:strand:+ start:2324 stop:3142 length:819 start_codon:yes stop_codon:yes gene_type:complete
MAKQAEKKTKAWSEVLRWYQSVGADHFFYSKPKDHFDGMVPSKHPAQSSDYNNGNILTEAATGAIGSGLQSHQTTLQTAREISNECKTVEELRSALETFSGCPLADTATKFVFADGDPNAKIMFIGEAPGAEEDRQGIPFVGPAGKLLNKMLAAINLTRDKTYITNIIPWRPPGNRNPTDAEIGACLPFLEQHISLITPEIVIFLGGVAAKTLLQTNEGIMRLRGKWTAYKSSNGEDILARALLHPAYLLRQPSQKRETWRDLIEIKKKLKK